MRVVLVITLVGQAASAMAGLRGGANIATRLAQEEVFLSQTSTDSQVALAVDAVEEAETTAASSFQSARDFFTRATARNDPKLAGQGTERSGLGWMGRIVLQILFGLIYYAVVVRNYPKMEFDEERRLPQAAVDMQSLDSVSACCHPEMSFPNAAMSFLCTGPRQAHTLHTTGTMNYWLACCLMSVFPCCTLFYTNAFTDLNTKLGGEKQNVCTSFMCSFCCSCCLVAQDAQTMDMATGRKTGMCYVM